MHLVLTWAQHCADNRAAFAMKMAWKAGMQWQAIRATGMRAFFVARMRSDTGQVMNDVWKTEDGVQWACVTATAQW